MKWRAHEAPMHASVAVLVRRNGVRCLRRRRHVHQLMLLAVTSQLHLAVERGGAVVADERPDATAAGAVVVFAAVRDEVRRLAEATSAAATHVRLLACVAVRHTHKQNNHEPFQSR